MAEQTKEELDIETAEFIADKGYESRKDIEKCIMHGTIPNVGFKYDKDERIHDLEYIPAEINEETRSSCKPEDIQKCLPEPLYGLQEHEDGQHRTQYKYRGCSHVWKSSISTSAASAKLSASQQLWKGAKAGTGSGRDPTEPGGYAEAQGAG